MAKTLSQGRKPGSGRKPGKGKTLRNGRKPGSGRRRRDGATVSPPRPPSQPNDPPLATASSKSQVSSRDLEAIDALRELNNSPPEPLTPTLTPTQSKNKNPEIVHKHTNEGPFVTHTRMLSNPSVSNPNPNPNPSVSNPNPSVSNPNPNSNSNSNPNLNPSPLWNSLAQPQPVNGLVGVNSIGLKDSSSQQDENRTHREGPSGLLIHSYI